jgi:hypothetical protein
MGTGAAGSAPGTVHRGTRCADCLRSWSSLREIHCVVCHEQFGGEVGFTLHQKAGRCNPSANGRLTKDTWGVWRLPYGANLSLRNRQIRPANGHGVPTEPEPVS